MFTSLHNAQHKQKIFLKTKLSLYSTNNTPPKPKFMSADAMLKAVSAVCDIWAALFLMAFVKFNSNRN